MTRSSLLGVLVFAVAQVATGVAIYGTATGLGLAAFFLLLWAFVLNSQRPFRTAIWYVTCCFVSVFVVGLFVPMVARLIENPHGQCRWNLRQIIIALHNYQDEYGRLPPVSIADETGKPMHSWRVFILPYVDYPFLFDEYRFDEPWDGPNNSKLAEDVPNAYRCYNHPRGQCAYMAVTDADGNWHSDLYTEGYEVPDGILNGVMVAESPRAVPWMQPVDITIDELVEAMSVPEGQESFGHPVDRFLNYSHQYNVARANMTVHTVHSGQDNAAVRRFLIGEATDEVWDSQKPHIKWGKVSTLTAFWILAVLPAIVLAKRLIRQHRLNRHARLLSAFHAGKG